MKAVFIWRHSLNINKLGFKIYLTEEKYISLLANTFKKDTRNR